MRHSAEDIRRTPHINERFKTIIKPKIGLPPLSKNQQRNTGSENKLKSNQFETPHKLKNKRLSDKYEYFSLAKYDSHSQSQFLNGSSLIKEPRELSPFNQLFEPGHSLEKIKKQMEKQYEYGEDDEEQEVVVEQSQVLTRMLPSVDYSQNIYKPEKRVNKLKRPNSPFVIHEEKEMPMKLMVINQNRQMLLDKFMKGELSSGKQQMEILCEQNTKALSRNMKVVITSQRIVSPVMNEKEKTQQRNMYLSLPRKQRLNVGEFFRNDGTMHMIQ